MKLGDLTSKEAIKKIVVETLEKWAGGYSYIELPTGDAIKQMKSAINNAPVISDNVAYDAGYAEGYEDGFDKGYEFGRKDYERPQGEYVDISKLRLMTVEECAGHTIEYAMGWKACVEWIKKGGAE